MTRFCHFIGGGYLSKRKIGSRERVIKFLEATAPEEFTPKEIAVRCAINPNSVKKIVSRLFKEGKIEKSFHGTYRGKITIEKMIAMERASIKIHGIKIEFTPVVVKRENGRIVTEGGEGLSLCHRFNDTNLAYQDNTQIVYIEEFLGRKVTVQLMRNIVGIFMDNSESPLDYQEFKAFRYWIEGRFGNAFMLGNPVLRQVGLNKDYSELRLDGISSIKLQKWENAWAQIYQKAEDVLRREVHLVPKNLSLDEAIKMLQDQAEMVEHTPIFHSFHDFMYQ
ncbi:MAG: hypothetical protein JW939_09300 [Candidatus Thermoplasmatota archaeon]|nr:hypothetical protein [Candidatus Thermoplasmatota archaeon]